MQALQLFLKKCFICIFSLVYTNVSSQTRQIPSCLKVRECLWLMPNSPTHVCFQVSTRHSKDTTVHNWQAVLWALHCSPQVGWNIAKVAHIKIQTAQEEAHIII